MTNRAGTLVDNLSGEMAYESFRPAPLPPNPPIEVSGELLTKLIDANKKIATLEGLSSRIPNMGLFVSMFVRKEALLSSQIEGTQKKILANSAIHKTGLAVREVLSKTLVIFRQIRKIC